jgi:hypothetical protein
MWMMGSWARRSPRDDYGNTIQLQDSELLKRDEERNNTTKKRISQNLNEIMGGMRITMWREFSGNSCVLKSPNIFR